MALPWREAVALAKAEEEKAWRESEGRLTSNITTTRSCGAHYGYPRDDCQRCWELQPISAEDLAATRALGVEPTISNDSVIRLSGINIDTGEKVGLHFNIQTGKMTYRGMDL